MFTKIENKCSKQQEQFLCLQAAMPNVHIYTFINMCQVSTLLSMYQDNTWTTFSYKDGQQTFCLFIFQIWSVFFVLFVAISGNWDIGTLLPDTERRCVFVHILLGQILAISNKSTFQSQKCIQNYQLVIIKSKKNET